MIRRNKNKTPERSPHPDPAVEIRLQRIISLRESAARKADLIQQYQHEIRKLGDSYRGMAESSYPRNNTPSQIAKQMDNMHQQIRELEEDINLIHEKIYKHSTELSETDLSFL
jgi:Na+/phosphate symporter